MSFPLPFSKNSKFTKQERIVHFAMLKKRERKMAILK
jgi:hypothetical protein